MAGSDETQMPRTSETTFWRLTFIFRFGLYSSSQDLLRLANSQSCSAPEVSSLLLTDIKVHNMSPVLTPAPFSVSLFSSLSGVQIQLLGNRPRCHRDGELPLHTVIPHFPLHLGSAASPPEFLHHHMLSLASPKCQFLRQASNL